MKNIVVSYVQPAVEVIEIEIEKGFANSQLENPGAIEKIGGEK